MTRIVGVAEMAVSRDSRDVLVTHALGSCLGIAVHDPEARVGGLLHVMLPSSRSCPEKAAANPFMFVDTATPLFFRRVYEEGGEKGRLKVRVAGGASSRGEGEDLFAIGRRNIVMLRKLFWKNGIIVASQDVGGAAPRTLSLEIETGRTWLKSGGKRWELR